jgi:beta-lactamase regulating signal transducer with metallopeptidase domain
VGLTTWLAGALLLLALFLHARRRFFRSLADRRSGEFTLAGNALRAVVDQARVTRPIRLTMSDSLTSPVALGSDEICIPRRVLAELDPIRMESILAHELAHLERRDPFWLTTARVVEAVFFFQPLNRLARARLQESAEFASDGWAAGVISRPLDLAHCLARVAEWTIGSTRLVAPAMAERRGAVLVRRVQRLTDDAHRESAVDVRGLRLAGLATMLALVTLAPRALVGGPVSLAARQDNVFMLRLDSARADIRGGPQATHDVRIVRFSPVP